MIFREDASMWEKNFTDILTREITEELGETITYTIAPQNPSILRFTSRTGKFDDNTPIRAIVLLYEGMYITGDIQISSEHASYTWVDSAQFDTTHCMVGEQFGKGLNDYLHKPT